MLHAVALGLGSIFGTGVYFGILEVSQISGSAILWCVAAAGLLAACNALSSAQLAAVHPVSGGTYEYGYRLLSPRMGFAAGWMFLCAKSASAATATLAIAQYLTDAAKLATSLHLPIAFGVLLLMVAVVLSGIRRSAWLNLLLVLLTVGGLGVFCVAVFSTQIPDVSVMLRPPPITSLSDLFRASALMFVAYTGYGRVATLGEEITEPARNIPRAIIGTLLCSLVVYGIVAVAVFFASAGSTHPAAESLALLAEGTASRTGLGIITFGAVSAMLGVLLNLILGLSRVVLAMARRGDLPDKFGQVASTNSQPVPAILLVGVIIGSLIAIGSPGRTWSLSALHGAAVLWPDKPRCAAA
ncbi:MAG: APC family permease [Planctomycetaceae bacterium]